MYGLEDVSWILIIGKNPCYSQDVSCAHLIEGTCNASDSAYRRGSARGTALGGRSRGRITSSISGWVPRVDVTPEHRTRRIDHDDTGLPMGDYITDQVRRAVGALLPDGVAVTWNWSGIRYGPPTGCPRGAKQNLWLARLKSGHFHRSEGPLHLQFQLEETPAHDRDHHHPTCAPLSPASAIRSFSAPSNNLGPRRFVLLLNDHDPKPLVLPVPG